MLFERQTLAEFIDQHAFRLVPEPHGTVVGEEPHGTDDDLIQARRQQFRHVPIVERLDAHRLDGGQVAENVIDRLLYAFHVQIVQPVERVLQRVQIDERLLGRAIQLLYFGFHHVPLLRSKYYANRSIMARP